MTKLVNVRCGSSKVVHFVRVRHDGQFGLLPCKGQPTKGWLRKTDDDVTCKTCLKMLDAAKRDRPSSDWSSHG